MHHFEVEKFENEDEFFANSIDDQLILRTEDFLKVELALSRLGDRDNNREAVHTFQNGGPVLDVSFHLLPASRVDRLIKVHRIILSVQCLVHGICV